MEIKEITDKNIWESFLLNCKEKTFLDSWNWGMFQDKQEDKIWRWGVYDSEQLVGVALVVKIIAKRGIFLFIPHAPAGDLKSLSVLTEKLKELAKKEMASFIRIAPICKNTEENRKVFKTLGFRDAPIHIHPELTWELDITPAEDDILAGMRKTTRYLIKKAQKDKDIEIVKSTNLADLEIFHQILMKTAGRHGFVPFSLNYLTEQFSCFAPDSQILIWLGKHEGKVVSSAVTIYWQKMGFYHHGASIEHNSNKTPVTYLQQWEMIKEAKSRGCISYNFWGISTKPNHPWAGLSQFKMGFGGREKEYVKTQ
ncbi:MAG: peptidoglycan bridge formation glycyltransferase FemA/FemB family protein, partial [bacterium]|nr:peptidoglycan bridge formation glycyltransferase FemA/FemB family protein [bacterium]